MTGTGSRPPRWRCRCGHILSGHLPGGRCVVANQYGKCECPHYTPEGWDR